MDPDTCLEEIMDLALKIKGEYPDDPDVEALDERLHALDGWLSRGGFLPQPWRAGR